jgi:hypothetical protein
VVGEETSGGEGGRGVERVRRRMDDDAAAGYRDDDEETTKVADSPSGLDVVLGCA